MYYANTQLAIDTLLITDKLLQNCNDFIIRKQYMDLMDSVKEHGGKVEL